MSVAVNAVIGTISDVEEAGTTNEVISGPVESTATVCGDPYRAETFPAASLTQGKRIFLR